MPPTLEDVRTVVELAGLAPSVHNSQPWRWRWTGEALELSEDAERRLEVVDPSGRERVLSCGAALLHARLGFAELGWDVDVHLLPEGEDGPLLARLVPGDRREATPEERALTAAAPRRATDRDPYDERPVPQEVLADLRRAAEAEGAWLHVVDREHGEVDLDVLLSLADAAQRSDPRYLEELETWRGEGPTGVPDRALPTVPAASRGDSLSLRDYDAGRPPAAAAPAAGDGAAGDDAPVPEHPTVLVLGTLDDGREDWLRAGSAVARLLLRATVDGVAAQPITSVLEVPVLRARLRGALGLVGAVQMVLRAGYGTAGPATRRLPVDRVLDVTGD